MKSNLGNLGRELWRSKLIINDCVNAIINKWQFDKENYPNIETLGEAIRHIILHQCKDTGKLAAAIEPIDHDNDINYDLMIRSIRNSIINMFRLCALVGMSPDNLIQEYLDEPQS